MKFKNLTKRVEKVEYEAVNGHFYDTKEEAEQASKVLFALVPDRKILCLSLM